MTPLIYARIGLILAVLAIGVYAGIRWESGKIASLKVEISRLQAREVIYEQSNAQCAQSVKAANAGTEQLLAKQKQNEERSRQALKAAQVESAKLATSIATLRATAAPADTSCQAQSDGAKGILLEEVRRRIATP